MIASIIRLIGVKKIDWRERKHVDKINKNILYFKLFFREMILFV